VHTSRELIMGILDSPRVKGIVRWATASTGRWFLTGGQGGAFSSVGGGIMMTGLWLRPGRSRALGAPRARGTRGEGGLLLGTS